LAARQLSDSHIHTVAFPGGEFRGQLTVSEPASLTLSMLSLGGVLACAWVGRRFAA